MSAKPPKNYVCILCDQIHEAGPTCPLPSSFAAPAGSVASPYVVRRRESDDRWCIYLKRYNCVVAEFGPANNYDAETIKEILEGTKPPNDQAV